MRVSGKPGAGAWLTVRVALPATPFGAVAVMVAPPGARPVATPDALTTATSGALLANVNETSAIGWPSPSRAVAVNACAPPAAIVAEAGATTTLATSGGGGGPSALHAPKVLAMGPVQPPEPPR